MAAAAALCTTLLVALFRNDEPLYKGRTLTSWLIAYKKATYFTTNSSESAQEPRQALQAIGTNAMPYLMHWLTNEQRLNLFTKIPSAVRESEIYDDFAARWDPEERSWLAIWGFEVLGPQAASAFPQLLSMIQGTNEDTAVLATLCIGHIGTNADAAIPFLAKAVSGGTQRLPIVAIMTLGTIGRNPEICVPALERCLSSSSDPKRALAARSLGKFGSAAKESAAALVGLLDDPNVSVRRAGTNALLAIAPEALTNAAPQ